MARPLATLAAFVLSVIGVNMFGSNYDPASGCSELWASFIVKLGMYFLLLDVNLYQKNFKKLHHVPLFFYEMVTASFFIETVVHYIWMPIEKYLVQNVPKLVKCLCMNLVRRTISGQVFELIIKFTFSQSMMTFYCYMLSIMFVLCVLHATRSLDFRLIRLLPAPGRERE